MKFYRYEHDLYLYTFSLIKETPSGYWITNNKLDGKSWISKHSRKRFAYPTKEEALESFKARKRRQIKIVSAQLRSAERNLQLAEGTIKRSNIGFPFDEEY